MQPKNILRVVFRRTAFQCKLFNSFFFVLEIKTTYNPVCTTVGNNVDQRKVLAAMVDFKRFMNRGKKKLYRKIVFSPSANAKHSVYSRLNKKPTICHVMMFAI